MPRLFNPYVPEQDFDHLSKALATPTVNFPLDPVARTSAVEAEILPEAPSLLAPTESTTERRKGETGAIRGSNSSQSNGPRKVLPISDFASLTLLCNEVDREKRNKRGTRKQMAMAFTTGSSGKRVSKTSNHTKWVDTIRCMEGQSMFASTVKYNLHPRKPSHLQTVESRSPNIWYCAICKGTLPSMHKFHSHINGS